MFRRIQCLSLILIMLITLAGCQSNKISEFSFRNGITWKSTVTDVALAEGDATKKQNAEGWLDYSDVQVSNYVADDLAYIFVDDALTAIRYRFFSLTSENTENLVESLEEKYGKPTATNKEHTMELMNLVGLDNSMFMSDDWHSDYINWKLADGTFIVTWNDRRGYQILYLNSALLSEWISKPNSDGL